MSFWKLVICSSVILFVSYIYLVWISEDFKSEDLVGKNVLVTGASSGIGKAVAIQYAKYGANVFITARREELLQEVVALCKAVGRPNAKFGYVTADMANYSTETERVIKEAVAFLGRLDHLFLNHALIEMFHQAWTGTAKELSNMVGQFDTGMFSYVHLTAHALRYLKKANPGRIGIMGSLTGKMQYRSMPSYCAVKFALDGFYSSLRELFEQDGTNITVTYHALGPIATESEGPRYMPKSLFDVEQCFFYTPISTPELAAEQVVQATARGDAELYFPHLFGYIPGGCRLMPIIRHLWHNLIRAA